MKLSNRSRSKSAKRRSGHSLAILSLSALCCAALLMVARADDRALEFTPRIYVGAGVGATQLEPKMPNGSLTVSDDTDSGFDIAVGYDFSSRLSAEVYYGDFGSAGIAFIGADVGTVDYQVFGLSGIAYLLNSRSGLSANKTGSGMGTREGLSLYTRVGLGGVVADSELDHTVKNPVHLALGLGAEYGFGNGFAVRGEYRALDTDMHYASVSLLKRFGQVRSTAPIAATTRSAVQPAPQKVEPVTAVTPKSADLDGVTTVNFAFDRSEISPQAASKLDKVAAALSNSDVSVSLEGHTDWIASERYNQELSIRRAESVRRYLEAKGISRSRLSVRGFGETRPVASNNTVEGRASNRRADIRIK